LPKYQTPYLSRDLLNDYFSNAKGGGYRLIPADELMLENDNTGQILNF
jgi:hypothetical protein